MRLLITGGAKFIGSNLAERPNSAGCHPSNSKRKFYHACGDSQE